MFDQNLSKIICKYNSAEVFRVFLGFFGFPVARFCRESVRIVVAVILTGRFCLAMEFSPISDPFPPPRGSGSDRIPAPLS